MSSIRSLYARLGGHATLEQVHRLFYDEVFAHPWLGRFFEGIDQAFLEDQQTAFMAAVMGGPKRYVGQYPRPAHRHMFLTDELFDLRNRMLGEAIAAADVPAELAAEWLRLDNSFRNAVVKKTVDDCEQRYPFEPLMIIDDPRRSGRAAG